MELHELFVPVLALKRGETAQMARYLADGGEVTPAIRQALVKYLRNPQPAKPSKRTHSQQSREFQIVLAFIGLHHVQGLSRAEAIREILRGEPNLTLSTVENYLRNYKKKSAR
jgi:hypothetical protein